MPSFRGQAYCLAKGVVVRRRDGGLGCSGLPAQFNAEMVKPA